MDTNKKVETISQEDIEILEPENKFVNIDNFEGKVIEVDEFIENGEIYKKSFLEKLEQKAKKVLFNILEDL